MYFDPYCFSKEGIKEFINERAGLYVALAHRFPKDLYVGIYHDNTDPASAKYVKNKLKRFEFYGIKARVTDSPVVYDNYVLNGYPTFIQQPFSSNESFDITHDCEGLANNDVITQTQKIGYYPKDKVLWPCTAKGIFEHLEWSLKRNFIEDKPHVVIVGRSDLVGKPLARLLLANDYTVSVIHSHTPKLTRDMILTTADVIVSATGCRGWLDDVEGHTGGIPIYDVGINFEDGHICGDIVNPSKWTTPVPFGVGRLTVEALCWNIIDWYYRNLK